MNKIKESFAPGTPQGLISQWEKVYKNALKTYNGDAKRAAATAWASVKTNYKQGADGKWSKKESKDLGVLAKKLLESLK